MIAQDVAAFDVDAKKVGFDLSEAISASRAPRVARREAPACAELARSASRAARVASA